MFSRVPPPPQKEKKFKAILILLDNAEKLSNLGDKDAEMKIWQMISEKALNYASKKREVPIPEFTQDITT